MEVRIQISDAVYAQLLNSTKRIRGSIALVSPKKGNFNAYVCGEPEKNSVSMKLPHGRVRVGEADVRMYLKVSYKEQVVPARTIEAESVMASSFIDLMEELQ